MDMDRLKVPMQIKLHPGGCRSYYSVRINGRNIPGPQRNFLWHLLLRESLVSQKDVEETEPWQWESILHAHLIVHAMVCFLGLLVVFVIFLTLCAMKNTCWMLRPCAHTCCCLMVWGCFGDKSRFSRGDRWTSCVSNTLYFSLSRVFDRSLATVERYQVGRFILCCLLGLWLRTFSKS